jgi:prepilin-type N-terminal cleavage/methylation domain-containing protein
MKNQKNCRAFSLFEIVVSIVVLGIISTAFPLILQSITQSAKTVTKEEIVLNEMSLLNMVFPFYFDENNTKDDNFYKDLNASNGDGDSELLINSYAPYTKYARLGKSQFNNNELRSGSSDDVSDIGIDSGEVKNDVSTYDDIDDFDGYEENVSGHTLKVSVYYINDETNYSAEDINFTYDYNTKKNKTNIKLIKISSDNNITLYYPTCNIGESKFISLEELSR